MTVSRLTVGDVFEHLDTIAPFDTAEPYDNVGLLLGDLDAPVSQVGVTLDLTHAVVDEVLSRLASGGEPPINLILTHHPLMFHPIKRILSDSVLHRLIAHNIAVIALHTNLDRTDAPCGTNVTLCRLLGLQDVTAPAPLEGLGRLGRVGSSEGVFTVASYVSEVTRLLGAPPLRYLNCKRPVERLAVVAGSGGSLLDAAIASGADTLLTGDIKHDQMVEAYNRRLNLIEVGHFDVEQLALPPLAEAVASLGVPVALLAPHNPWRTI